MTTTAMATVTRPYARRFVEWAATRPHVVCLSADLSSSCEVDDFRAAYPERFFSMGMAEQNMMAAAGGMAREGLQPFVHTFAVFVTRRPYDQVAMQIAYPALPVRLMGFLPGLTTPGGVTHQAIDDLSLMRTLPNMTVLDLGDATEVESVLDAIEPLPGPVYARILRGAVPRLFNTPLEVGRVRHLGHGEDVCLISSGVSTEEAVRAALVLRERDVGVAHLHAPTIKPFDDPAVVEAAAGARAGVVTVENHSIVGGLGSAVAERLAEAGVGRPLARVGVPDTFTHGGSRDYLFDLYGLSARHVVRAVEGLLGRTLGISDDEVAGASAAPAEEGKAEAL